MSLRLSLLAALLTVFSLGGLYIMHLRDEARQARSERDAAVAVAEMRTAEGKTVERLVERETVIRETAEPIITTIEESAGAETLLPDDVLAAWSAGVTSLRNEAPAADDQRPDDPE